MTDLSPLPVSQSLVVLPQPGDARRVRRGFWRKVKRTAGKVPFVDDAVSAYYCAIDAKTPLRVRGVLLEECAARATATKEEELARSPPPRPPPPAPRRSWRTARAYRRIDSHTLLLLPQPRVRR